MTGMSFRPPFSTILFIGALVALIVSIAIVKRDAMLAGALSTSNFSQHIN
jgi:hypothetical protein